MIATAAGEDTAVAVDVGCGQASDFTLAPGVIDRTLARGPGDERVGDQGFDRDAVRGHLIDRHVCPVIPNERNRVDPWPFDPEAYRERNTVERRLATAKPFRRFATRYEKLRRMSLGVVHLVLAFVRLRRLATVNTA